MCDGSRQINMIDRLVLKRPKHLLFTHNFDDLDSMPPHIPELIIHQLMKLPLFLMRGSMVGRVGAHQPIAAKMLGKVHLSEWPVQPPRSGPGMRGTVPSRQPTTPSAAAVPIGTFNASKVIRPKIAKSLENAGTS